MIVDTASTHHPRLRRARRRARAFSSAARPAPASRGSRSSSSRPAAAAGWLSRGSSPTTAFTSRRSTGACSRGRPPNLAGLIEVRGLGIRRLPYEPVAVVRLVVDLAARRSACRRPPLPRRTIEGVRLPRLAVAPGADAFPLVLAALTLHTSRPDRLRPALGRQFGQRLRARCRAPTRRSAAHDAARESLRRCRTGSCRHGARRRAVDAAPPQAGKALALGPWDGHD